MTLAGAEKSTAPALMDRMNEYTDVLAVSTCVAYTRTAERVIKRFLFFLGPRGLSSALQSWVVALSGKGLSPKTILNYATIVRGFLKWAGHGDAASNLRLPKVEESLPNYLSPEEIEDVLRAARQTGIWPEVQLALATGLRVGELARLKWRDVDFDRKLLYVMRSKSKRVRQVPLSRQGRLALRYQRRKTGRMTYVFPARRTFRKGFCLCDKPRGANTWQDMLRPVQDAVPAFRRLRERAVGRGWHLFRSTMASRLASEGVSIYKIAEWLGHRDVNMTARLYAHLQSRYDPDIEWTSP